MAKCFAQRGDLAISEGLLKDLSGQNFYQAEFLLAKILIKRGKISEEKKYLKPILKASYANKKIKAKYRDILNKKLLKEKFDLDIDESVY